MKDKNPFLRKVVVILVLIHLLSVMTDEHIFEKIMSLELLIPGGWNEPSFPKKHTFLTQPDLWLTTGIISFVSRHSPKMPFTFKFVMNHVILFKSGYPAIK